MKKIAWEKWRDDEHYIETSEDLESDFEKEYSDEEDDSPRVDVTVYPHMVRTPLGMFSVLDENLPSKMFDCWIGHFNFPIDEEVFEILDNDIDGIEVLRVLSKYRIFIGVAKLFSFRDVSCQINQVFLSESEEKKQQNVED